MAHEEDTGEATIISTGFLWETSDGIRKRCLTMYHKLYKIFAVKTAASQKLIAITSSGKVDNAFNYSTQTQSTPLEKQGWSSNYLII